MGKKEKILKKSGMQNIYLLKFVYLEFFKSTATVWVSPDLQTKEPSNTKPMGPTPH
jgi:hypothetical protein